MLSCRPEQFRHGLLISFPESRHARLPSHGHLDVAALHSSVHLERVNQGYSRALTIAYRDFSGAPPATDGAFPFSLFAQRYPAVPLR